MGKISPFPVSGNATTHALARAPFHEGELLAVAGPVDQEGDRPVPLDKLSDQELAQLAETAHGAEREAAGVALVLGAEAARRAPKDGAA